MALAIASGLKLSGIFTSIIGGFLISLFGGSRVQIAGPRVRLCPCSVPIVVLHGPQGWGLALMAGVILFALGAAKLGVMIKYIPYPVVTGFTSGISIIILSTQMETSSASRKTPADFVGKLRGVVDDFHRTGQRFCLATIAALIAVLTERLVACARLNRGHHCCGGGGGILSPVRPVRH